MNIHVSAGMATLPAQFLALRNTIDECALLIGDALVAQRYQFPPLIPAADIDRFDYFKNFPHLPLVVSHTKPVELSAEREISAAAMTQVPQHLVEAGSYVLPPAACYNVYLHLKDRQLDSLHTFSTVAQCFRRESHYRGLERLQAFTMREIVLVGPKEEVVERLDVVRQRVIDLAQSLGIEACIKQAADPFLQADSPRALMQKLTSVKQELVYGDELAISSFNFHRNFFGERCNITTPDGGHAFSACMGIGLERWLHALLDTCEQNADVAQSRLEAVRVGLRERLSVSAADRSQDVCCAE